MWLTDKDIQKQIRIFSACLCFLLGYQCANKPNSNLRLLKSKNSFAGYPKIECYWYVLLYFKLCFQMEFSPLLVCGGNAEFHCLDGKRFAEKLDRYITTVVFKDGRRCKCIIWKSISCKLWKNVISWAISRREISPLVFIFLKKNRVHIIQI